MSIPLIIGSCVGTAFILASRLMASSDRETWFKLVPATLVRGVFIGSLSGALAALFAKPIVIEGFYQDSQFQHQLFSDSTVVLVKAKGVEKQIKVPGLVLGLEKGEKVFVEGNQYFVPQFSDFDKVHKQLS